MCEYLVNTYVHAVGSNLIIAAVGCEIGCKIQNTEHTVQ